MILDLFTKPFSATDKVNPTVNVQIIKTGEVLEVQFSHLQILQKSFTKCARPNR